MNINYICNHILRTAHLQIRQYSIADGNKLLHYYGDSLSGDILEADKDFADKLITMGNKEYPVIFMEEHPIYYAVV